MEYVLMRLLAIFNDDSDLITFCSAILLIVMYMNHVQNQVALNEPVINIHFDLILIIIVFINTLYFLL